LRLAAELRGDEVAQAIQLHMAYAPEPPFDSGTPETAPSPILEQARRSVRTITLQREHTARRVAAKLGIAVPAAGGERPRRRRASFGENRGFIGAPAKGCGPN